jgi:superfamily I DNA and RNA helicase
MFLNGRKTHRKWLAAILFMALTASPCMAEDEKQHTKSLSAQQLKDIQFMSRTVLAAKHSRKEDPELAEMRAHIEKLQSSIANYQAQRLKAVEYTQQALRRGYDKQGIIMPQSEAIAKVNSDEQAAMNHLQTTLHNMRNNRMNVQKTIANSRQGKFRHRLIQTTNKVEQLETELQAILAGPEEHKMPNLDAFQKRLEMRTLNRTVPVNDTPTISTLVQHRELPAR